MLISVTVLSTEMLHVALVLWGVVSMACAVLLYAVYYIHTTATFMWDP